MSFQHTSTYRVRSYECDANGHVNNVNYVRYVLETHARALTGAGHDPGTLISQDRVWQVRDLFIEFLRPLTFGDCLSVTLALDGLAGSTARWVCECRNSGSDELCAEAQVESEFLDGASGAACPLPPPIAKVLVPAEAVRSPLRHSRFPVLPSRPAGAVSADWEIHWRDVGPDRLLHSATYLDYLSDFLTHAAAAAGRTFQHDVEDGLAWVIRRQWLRIVEPALLGQGLRFSTWISDVKRVTVMRHFTIHDRDNESLIGEAHTLWVCVDSHTGRPARIPRTFMEGFAPQMSRE